MSFSTEIEQATRSAWATMRLAQQMQSEALIQSMLASQPRMNYCGCDDDNDEPASSSDWLSSFMQTNSMMMWASMMMSAAMDQLMSVVGRLAQAGRSSSSRSSISGREPAAASIQGGRSSTAPGAGWSGFDSPLKNHPITSVFGPRIDPVDHQKCRFHKGVDIGAPRGTPIRAPAGGKVVAAGWLEGYGNYMRIDHGNGRETAYGHCSALLLKPGDEVKKGQVIARVGSTGHSNGPHLHYEVIYKGVKKNPMKYVPI